MRSPRKALQLIVSFTLIGAAAESTDRSPLLAPSGKYKVGRTHFEWTDNSREEAENPGHRREVIVWVWYPAVPRSGAGTAEWMPGKWGEHFSSTFVADHPDAANDLKEHAIRSIKTNAYPDAPAASAKQPFPLLLFAPGTGSLPLDYASLIEDLVSHGYIVAGIVPTYYGRVSIFSDGRIVEGLDIRAIQTGPRGRGPRTAEYAMQRMQDVVGIWGDDLSFTLKQLEKTNADVHSPLKGHFDFSRIGAVGHSMGGAAVAEFGHREARVRAVFDIDGSPIWNHPNEGLGKALLILSAASTPSSYGNVLGGARPGLHLRLGGSTHPFPKDFLLVPFIAQHRNTGQARPDDIPAIDPKRAIQITQAYAKAFFDHYLNGKTAALLEGPSSVYPEITFTQE